LPTKWRKKPVVIEARQLVRHEAECIAKWCDGQWLSLYGRGDNGEDISHVLIPTLEGAMRAEIGDWIIKGVKGEFYPCKPDIFAATYEPAGAAPSTPPLNELLGQPEEFNLNEVSGNSGQLASLEQRARHVEVLRAIGSAFVGIPSPCEEREAVDAAIAALSAQPRGEPIGYIYPGDVQDLKESREKAADSKWRANVWATPTGQAGMPVYAAPQPREVRGVVPPGFALVPIEPTWDMRNEGREFLIDGIEKEPEKLAYFLWKTMVAAAPEVK
jgi:hypothetical protein